MTDKHRDAWEKRRMKYGPGGHTDQGVPSMWKSISGHKDRLMKGGYFVALGDHEMAVVWFEPEAGAKWKVRSMLGAVRLAMSLDGFHSWCSIYDLHEFHNLHMHPERYMTGAEIAARKQNT